MAAHLEEVTYSGIKLALHRQRGVIKWVTGWRKCKTMLSPGVTAVPKKYYCEFERRNFIAGAKEVKNQRNCNRQYHSCL